MNEIDARRAIDAVWRIESAKIIAGLVRMVRDVGLAEELTQDSLVAALEHWPQSGIPDNRAAWRRRRARRNSTVATVPTPCKRRLRPVMRARTPAQTD